MKLSIDKKYYKGSNTYKIYFTNIITPNVTVTPQTIIWYKNIEDKVLKCMTIEQFKNDFSDKKYICKNALFEVCFDNGKGEECVEFDNFKEAHTFAENNNGNVYDKGYNKMRKYNNLKNYDDVTPNIEK